MKNKEIFSKKMEQVTRQLESFSAGKQLTDTATSYLQCPLQHKRKSAAKIFGIVERMHQK